MGEAVTPLYRKLIDGGMFGEVPSVRTEIQLVEADYVTTIHGQTAKRDECFKVIRGGACLGWDKLF